MYIKSMVLEGFKSYAQRTEIYDFDPFFNAITGLNGSGKSNVLDGICFLLGISNLTQVRALNLNELVYKNGQGGVSKATVSITFDNSNKEQSPVGYSHFEEITVTRQIAIGNRNKYMINGLLANNQRVNDLFCSVQLNVNNPHFLIMQGRITKVLNMKPEEILSLVEEATGTSLYERKKENAKKMIKKKQFKLCDIDQKITEELNPALKKLKEDQNAYVEFQKVNRELDHLHKFYTAFKYYSLEKLHITLMTKHEGLEESSRQTQVEIESAASALEEVKKNIEQLELKKDKEAGGRLEKRTKDLDAANLNHAKLSTNLSTAQKALISDEAKLLQLQTQRRNDNVSIVDKTKRVDELEASLLEMEEGVKRDKKAHTDSIKNLQAVKMGLSSGGEGNKQSTVQEQLRNARMTISNAETQVKDTTLKLKHSVDDLRKQQAKVKKQDDSYQDDLTKVNKLTANISKLEDRLASLGAYSDEAEKALGDEHRSTESLAHSLSTKVNSLQARMHQMDFEYRDPDRDFDRRAVKGMVANLFTVTDLVHARALEVVAGGKLYQVVVDTEQTAKKILEKGDLKRRVTMIPLNKISASSIHPSILHRAQQLVGVENANTALLLVSYDEELEKAMQYVFGSSFVCTTMDVARKVTFNEGIKKKSITLDGSSFDPAGLASGGSKPRTQSVLLEIASLKEAQASLRQTELKLSQLNHNLKNMQNSAAQWRDVSDRLDISRSELRMLQEKVRNSAYGQQLEEIEALKKNIGGMEEGLKEAQRQRKEAEEKVMQLEGQLKDRDGHMRREVANAEKEMLGLKQVVHESSIQLEKLQQEHSVLRLEMGELGKELDETNDQTSCLMQAIESAKKELMTLQSTLSLAQEEVSTKQGLVTEGKQLLLVFCEEIEVKSEEMRQMSEFTHQNKLKVDDLAYQISQSSKQIKDDSKKLERMVHKNTWIEDEKSLFNVDNSAYDFRKNNPSNIESEIGKLEEVKGKLSRHVNTRAMVLLPKAEEQHKDVMTKLPSVIKDRETIGSVIKKLDQKKELTLQQALKQINKDFSSIYSTLLPGASAKLEPTMEDGILKGVAFKVAFGDVWKESLTELSGGQRSLIALSLILSFLRFKPAPLYILDEVDAALDLSHTQNIGQMLKAHFKHSQFIIVSLKDGMFNNANVLFRTSFNEGVSSVTRICQQDKTHKKHKNTKNKKK